MNPDRIHSPGSHASGKFFGMSMGKILRGTAEIYSVEADGRIRAIPECQMPVVYLDRAVLSRRGVETVGKIEDRASLDIAMVNDRLPRIAGSDIVWLSSISWQRTVTDRGGDNSPYRLSG